MKSLLEPSLSGRISQPSIVFPCVLRFVSGYRRFDLYLHTYIYIYVTFGYYFRELLHVSWSYSGHHLQMMFGVYKYTVTINWLFGETFFWWQLMTNNDKSYLKRERVLATRVASGTVSDRSMLLGNLCELCETWKIFRTDPTWKGFNEVWRGKNITKENLQFPPPGYKLIYNPI